MAKYVETKRYKPLSTRENQLFVFGDELGDGSDENHFHLGFTSHKLLRRMYEHNAQENGVFHLDSTYKIVKYNYPLFVLGYTDLNRHFHSVAFMYSSHEQIGDFEHFFRSFKNLCLDFDLEFSPKYIVTDAWKASAAAIASELPNTLHLMCYFHVKYNIRKCRNDSLPASMYQEVMKDVTDLHNTLSIGEFEMLSADVLKRWRKKPDMRAFADYFENTWLNSVFNRWQLFWTEPGKAHTNSPIESYNKEIKSSFTKRIKHHIKR